MELAFDSESLRNICEKEAEARGKLGPSIAELLKHRLADLRAAVSVKDLIVGRPRLIDPTDNRFMVIDLYSTHQIVFRANHTKNPLTERGDIDWPKVIRIKILRIEEIHEQS